VKPIGAPTLALVGAWFLVSVILADGCTRPVEPSGPPTESPGQFLHMLSLVPDTPDTRHDVRIDDYERVRNTLHITPSVDDELYYLNSGDFRLPLGSMLSRGFLTGVDAYAFQSPIKRNNVGFGPLDVDMDLTSGTPAYTFEIVKGRYDPQRTAEALANQPVMAREIYATQLYKNVIIHSWAEVPYRVENRLAAPVFDRNARALPIAVADGYVFRYNAVEGVKAMIDLRGGEKAVVGGMVIHSLASAPEYGLLANMSERLGAFSIYLSDRGKTPSDYPGKGFEHTPLLRHYTTMAIGTGTDEEGLYVTVILAHETVDSASQNVELLRRRINETSSLRTGEPWRHTVEVLDIHAEGTLLVARLRGVEADAILHFNEPFLLEESQ